MLVVLVTQTVLHPTIRWELLHLNHPNQATLELMVLVIMVEMLISILLMVVVQVAVVLVVLVEMPLIHLEVQHHPLVAPVEQERQCQYFLHLFLHPLYLHQIAPPGQTQSDPQDCLLVAAAVVLVEEIVQPLNLELVDLAEADPVVQML